MKADLLAAILAYYQADTTLQALLGGSANVDVKIAYTLLPIVYPSVTLHLDDDTGGPRMGSTGTSNMISDNSATLSLHNWAHDDGLQVGTRFLDANELQMEIADRLGVLSMALSDVPAIYAIANLRDLNFSSMPLPFEEDTHTHHTKNTLKFTYVARDYL